MNYRNLKKEENTEYNKLSNIAKCKRYRNICRKRKLDDYESINDINEKKVKIQMCGAKFDNKVPTKNIMNNYKYNAMASDEDHIVENFLGNMEVICNFCKAKHFLLEMPKDKKFNTCCHKGKVMLPEDPLYPEELKHMINGNTWKSKHFMEYIRDYNNAVAFASFGAKFIPFKNKGPQVFKICGQTYHNTYALHPNDNEIRKYSQLYIIDNEVATKSRKNSNNNCRNDILRYLDTLLRKINPYAEAYKMMHEIEKDEEESSVLKKSCPREIKMILKRHYNVDKNRYNLPTANEVAVVFVDDDGEPPIERDFCVFSKSNKPIIIPTISRHVDPMTYPLLYPAGGYGWMPKLLSTNKKNNITALQFYSYKFSVRDEFSPFLNLGKLNQQCSVDFFQK